MSTRCWHPVLIGVLILTGLCGPTVPAQADDAPTHGRPFFMPAQERARIQKLIATRDWAKADHTRTQKAARKGDGFLAAFLYALGGDPTYVPIAQKWLLGPLGAGFLFVDDAWLPEVEPTEVGWFTVENAEEYLDYRLDPKKDAGKFECGSLNVVGILGMGASMKILLDYGLANVEKRVMQITDCLCEGLKRRGYDVYSSRRNGEKSGIVLFASQSYPAEDVWRRLLDARIITSLRYGRVRVSPHFYNTDGDIEKLMGTLS